MSRPKMYRKALNCKVDGTIWDKLDTFCEETGLSKTVAVEQAIELYLKQKQEETEILKKANAKNK